MSNDPIVRAIVLVVQKQVAGGANWGQASKEIAKVACKRWSTLDRRHQRAKRIGNWDRVADVVKGFEATFATGDEAWSIPPGEWKWLAEALLPLLQGSER